MILFRFSSVVSPSELPTNSATDPCTGELGLPEGEEQASPTHSSKQSETIRSIESNADFKNLNWQFRGIEHESLAIPLSEVRKENIHKAYSSMQLQVRTYADKHTDIQVSTGENNRSDYWLSNISKTYTSDLGRSTMFMQHSASADGGTIVFSDRRHGLFAINGYNFDVHDTVIYAPNEIQAASLSRRRNQVFIFDTLSWPPRAYVFKFFNESPLEFQWSPDSRNLGVLTSNSRIHYFSRCVSGYSCAFSREIQPFINADLPIAIKISNDYSLTWILQPNTTHWVPHLDGKEVRLERPLPPPPFDFHVAIPDKLHMLNDNYSAIWNTIGGIYFIQVLSAPRKGITWQQLIPTTAADRMQSSIHEDGIVHFGNSRTRFLLTPASKPASVWEFPEPGSRPIQTAHFSSSSACIKKKARFGSLLDRRIITKYNSSSIMAPFPLIQAQMEKFWCLGMQMVV
jgi:hypothetical protein